MRFHHVLIATAAIALATGASARAAGYDVAPIGTKGAYLGCMAVNAGTGVAFVAVGNNLSVMLTSPGWKVVKGDPIDGTWSIDGGKERTLAVKADGPGTVSVDLEANKAALDLLGGGNELTGSIGKNSFVFDLGGSKQALSDLGDCMDSTAKK